MRTNYFLLTFLICTSAFSQQINWARNTPLPAHSKGLIADNQGYIYNYGSSYLCQYPGYINPNSSAVGSFINKYDKDGNPLASKTFSGNFHIQKLIYDNNSAFYFAGLFLNSGTYNGITITSRGMADGVVGKMDLSGNILWMKSFGAAQNDGALSLTLSSSGNSLVVTGFVTDSLFIDHSLVAFNVEKTLLLASFNLNGTLNSYKLINFLQGRNDLSSGMEIDKDNNGNYIMHVCREGKYWSNDPVNAPFEGRYIYKFDNALNEIWSSFVINSECYYGYSCGGLGVKANGDAYIPSYCSSKYGGTPTLRRLSGVNGNTLWIAPQNDDGGYNCTYVSGNDVFILGKEGAYVCPCPNGRIGYYVLKKFNDNNQLVGEARFRDVDLLSIVKSPDGTLFVSGKSWYNKSAKVGNDSVSGNFLMALSDIPCDPVALDTNGYNHTAALFCDTMKLDAGAGYSSYLWSNGSTDRFLKTTQEGWYNVVVTQTTGCVAHSMGSQIKKKEAPHNQEIYYVTYDNYIKKNVVRWWINYSSYFEDPPDFRVIKSAGATSMVDYKAGGDYMINYVDSLPWCDTSQVNYSIIAYDFCGNESKESPVHKTMLLKLKRPNGLNELQWTPYEGFQYSYFEILRGTNLNNMAFLKEVPASVTSFTDNTMLNYYYQIRIKRTNSDYVYSNPVTDKLTSAVQESALASKLSVYPNPSENDFTLRALLKEPAPVSIKVYDIRGSLVYNENLPEVRGEINRRFGWSAAPGIYFMEMTNGTNKEIIKLIRK
ncbi:MAG: hypothetical protein K0S12_497 [Bacteroidetes bacterium]|jgi:hypothetical protein|nr:hypothetical protein [Bacteroidota bacterium]